MPESHIQLSAKATPLAILSEGCFGGIDSKTATGVIRYGDWPIACVIDSTQAGKSIKQVSGINCAAPIVSNFDEALLLRPKALLLGTAPTGGVLPPEWRATVLCAIASGLHIISGLHSFLKDDPEFVKAAAQYKVLLWDVRNDTDQAKLVAQKKVRPAKTKVITLVGSDCAVGKMCTALELYAAAKAGGIKSEFIATGQTGILITGRGIPLDRIIGDFMAGHVERAISEAIEEQSPELIFVEGQGSLIHPGYSGVTMSLLHGCDPDALILCHDPALKTICDYPDVPMPTLPELIDIYETASSWTNGMRKKARVLGVALNLSRFDQDEAAAIIAQVERETGLPATDPISFGVAKLLDKIRATVYAGARS